MPFVIITYSLFFNLIELTFNQEKLKKKQRAHNKRKTHGKTPAARRPSDWTSARCCVFGAEGGR